jgi:lipopolysaccharide export system protein LptA
MRRIAICACFLLGFSAADLLAQNLTSAALASPAKPQKKPADKDPVKAAVGGSGLPAGEMITTEIYADEAFFDSANHIGIFTGHVIVNDPRFNVQSDKLTIYLNKNQSMVNSPKEPAPATEPGAKAEPEQALEKAVAEGNVGVVRERPDDKGGPPVRSVGRSDMAIYTSADGNVELRGTPRVQSGLNMHVATSPDTVMVINQTGQLVTKGPSRTEIRQEPKASPSPGAAPAPAKP